MDSTLFLFLEIVAFLFFFYGIERDSWQCVLIFVSTALFFALSLCSFNIEFTYFVDNVSSPSTFTTSIYDETYGYFNSGMGLISLSIGFIRTLSYQETLKPNKEEG